MTRYQAVIRLEDGEEITGITRKCKADAIQDLNELKSEYYYINANIEEWEF
jgi:hypothetical protein